MAVYYYLAVGCSTQLNALDIANHFHDLVLPVAEGLGISCEASTYSDQSGAWWSIIRPIGASINAYTPSGEPEPNLTDRAQRSIIGQLLYQHLRAAPPFRCAAYGWEVMERFFDDYNTPAERLQEQAMREEGWPGLVVEESLWPQRNPPPTYVPFRSGYVWQPYQGEQVW